MFQVVIERIMICPNKWNYKIFTII